MSPQNVLDIIFAKFFGIADFQYLFAAQMILPYKMADEIPLDIAVLGMSTFSEACRRRMQGRGNGCTPDTGTRV